MSRTRSGIGTADRERCGAMRPGTIFPGRKLLEKDFWAASAAKLFTVGCGEFSVTLLAAG